MTLFPILRILLPGVKGGLDITKSERGLLLQGLWIADDVVYIVSIPVYGSGEGRVISHNFVRTGMGTRFDIFVGHCTLKSALSSIYIVIAFGQHSLIRRCWKTSSMKYLRELPIHRSSSMEFDVLKLVCANNRACESSGECFNTQRNFVILIFFVFLFENGQKNWSYS